MQINCNSLNQVAPWVKFYSKFTCKPLHLAILHLVQKLIVELRKEPSITNKICHQFKCNSVTRHWKISHLICPWCADFLWFKRHCFVSGWTWQSRSWRKPGWRFWSWPSYRDPQQNLRSEQKHKVPTWIQPQERDADVYLIWPWTTKLTACLSACMRTAQSDMWMLGRVRRRPIKDSTYPNPITSDQTVRFPRC